MHMGRKGILSVGTSKEGGALHENSILWNHRVKKLRDLDSFDSFILTTFNDPKK